MIALLLAIAANCATSPADLLASNERAMGGRPASGTAIADYDYEGQGLEGSVTTTVDLATGRFLYDSKTPPLSDLHGFDGRTAWFRDLSGGFIPQGRNGRRAIAVSEAYVNQGAWWKKDRGGAKVELVGCNRLRVTPPGGNMFEAAFDPGTRLLSSIRETVTFGVSTETRFSDYQRRSGQLVPTRIEIFTEDDPSTRETMRLASFRVSPARASSNYAMPSARPGNWSIPAPGRVTVPFRLLNNHIVVDVSVNGKGPFPFVLDSGGHSIITPATVKALGISSKGESASGGSGEKMVTNGYAHVERIDVGGAALTDQTATTLDFSPLSVEGIQLGGMIGLEFLERFVVRIDYGARTLTIMDPGMFREEQRRRSGTPVPFTFYEHMPQVPGTFDGRPARFNIDTGSRSDVTMTSPYAERQKLRSAYPGGIEATEGWGVGGPARSYLVRARSMKLGPVEVPAPIAGLSTAKKGAMGDANYDGNVGSGALKRFIVTFDYAHQTIYLKPASRIDGDTGHFDRTGMWLNLGSVGLEVMDVAKGSPADIAGLKPKD
ncbi:MAG TPA: aspartyl protease family protein, partial [Sphingomicrobium sp.]|nr:aspartyl protease family protein [Sphingomicrobium sp.]